MGPKQREALAKMAESPNGEAGFRRATFPASLLKSGWATMVGYYGSRAPIGYYAITDEGRAALEADTKRPRRRKVVTQP